MGDKDNKNHRMENLSLDSNRYSQDFLTRLMENGWKGGKKEEFDDDREEIELNLGLSLGGRFGVDKCSTKLLRASSIAECLPFVKHEDDDDDGGDDSIAAVSGFSPVNKLGRTTSLPLESDEWRKRKELQTLRRMEAKRRRSEKQRNLNKEDAAAGQQLQFDSRVVVAPTAPPHPSSSSAVRLLAGGAGGAANHKGKGMDESQGRGGGGSSSSEWDNRSSLRGSRSCGDASQSFQENNNQETGSCSTKSIFFRTSSLDVQNPHKPSVVARNQARAVEDMPCVFTKGDGPNGRRVDGILYKFGKGEEVRIMCVCHGSFHSPTGFVKHAGGTDLTHPLKHIVMNPNSAPLT